MTNGVIAAPRFDVNSNVTVFTQATSIATATAEGVIGYDTVADLLKVCDGTNWVSLGGGVGSVSADSLDFTEFKDSMTLDASTDIAASGTNVLSITNTGTGDSFVVNDAASDTSPLVIDASGNVGIGAATPGALLDIAGKTLLNPMVADSATAVAYTFDSSNTLAATGAKLVSFKNNSVEKAYVTKDGGIRLFSDLTTRPGTLTITNNGNDPVITGGLHAYFQNSSATAGIMLNYNAKGTQFTSAGQSFSATMSAFNRLLTLDGHSTGSLWTISGNGGSAIPVNWPPTPVTISAGDASPSATVTLVGADLTLKGGAGSSGSTGAANGGKVFVYGGTGYGTGTSGSVILAYNGTSAVGNVGIGTTSPTNLLSLGGDAARTIWMERHTTANTAGNNLTVQSGGAATGATDKNGGDLILSSGTATGTGSSKIQFQTANAGTTGTADRAPATAMTILGNGNVGIGSSSSPSSLLDVNGQSPNQYGVFLRPTPTATAINQIMYGLYVNPTSYNTNGFSNTANVALGVSGNMQLANGNLYLGGVSGADAAYLYTLGVNGEIDYKSGSAGHVFRSWNSQGATGEFLRITGWTSTDVTVNGEMIGSYGIGRRSTGGAAGQALTVYAGGTKSGSTDQNGGDLVLSSGTATGTGSSNITFKTAPAGTTGTTDRAPATAMTILGNGNVGIGTTAPAAILHASSGSTNSSIRATGTAPSLELDESDTTNQNYQIQLEGGALLFRVNNDAFNGASTKMALLSSGNVGIGTTNPDQAKLEVKGGTVCVDTNSDDDATACITFESDKRLKKNIEVIPHALDTLGKLRGVLFDWRWDEIPAIADYKAIGRDAGVIAQEVEAVYPQGMGEELNGYKTVRYDRLIPLLIESVKELKAENDELRRRLDALEAKAQ